MATMSEPCLTCRATYGVPVEDRGRCGRCLTGLSLDGRPIFPARRSDGSWDCPCCGQKAIQLPDGTFMHAWTDGLLGATTAEMAERTASNRAAGIW